jgi:hypothetical protein
VHTKEKNEMKSQAVIALHSAAAVLAAFAWTGASFAQTSVVTEPAPQPQPVVVTPAPIPQPVVAEQTTYRAPNLPILVGGLVMFAGAYVPSVIVAAANDNSYDNHLYIPVVGPWLDLGDRPGCGGFNQTSCSTEGVYTALLIGSGVFQGLGAISTVVGLFVPERRTMIVTAKADKPSLHVLPAQVSRDGYGVAALGTF